MTPDPSLVAELARRSRVCWIRAAGPPGRTGPPRLVWHAWADGALLVLLGGGGPTDQRVEGLPPAGAADRAEVVLRAKDTRTRLVTWLGSVEVVAADDGRWEGDARALLGVRLNLAEPEEELRRWRRERALVRVTPVGDDGPDH